MVMMESAAQISASMHVIELNLLVLAHLAVLRHPAWGNEVSGETASRRRAF
jgi:hypothetical protein